MNVAILGAGQESQFVAKVIEDGYNPWLEKNFFAGTPLNVVAYTLEGGINRFSIGDKAVLTLNQFAALYHKKLIHKIIFPREIFFETQKSTLTELRKAGIDMSEVLVAARLTEEIFIPRFLEPYPSVRYLPHIEFRIAEQCNLNCKMCTEYCALVKEQKFYPLEDFKRDFEQLHKFVDDFGAIRILGGEPLLNPQVSEFVKICRELYPVSPLHVVTNAILLPKMPEEFFETVRRCNAIIWISFYPPLESKMPAIKQLLVEKNVRHYIGGKIESFCWRQTLKRNDNPKRMFELCGFSNCHNLCDGKIAACFLPFVTKYFNAYYGKNLPEDGALDLYDLNLTTEKLKAHLLRPFERCNYCTENINRKWETVTHPSPISDWVHD